MKKHLTTFLFFLLLLCTAALAAPSQISVDVYSQSSGLYAAASVNTVSLTLDGSKLSGDVPAMVWDDRTLVPVRLVAEAMDVQVAWVQETHQVVLTRGSDVITLTLGSATATVNGASQQLYDGVPAMIARYQGADRTMVPLRFVSEQLGCQVSWDQDSYTAAIASPAEDSGTYYGLVTKVQTDSDAQTVFIATDHTPVYAVQDFGDRVVVDLKGAALAPGLPGSDALDGTVISNIRYAQHDSSLYDGYASTVRVVLDLQSGTTYAKNITLQAKSNGLLLTAHRDDSESGGQTPDAPVTPGTAIIALDAGHGGDRSGAYYENIAEKTINLAVTLKVEAILKADGYQVIMTRDTDVEVSLDRRAEIANQAGADLFVSLHCNALENNTTYEGIMTYYYPSSNRGSKLAAAIQKAVIESTGGIDRMTRSADFAVLRETDMPASLVEMGFMTSHEELMKLTDDAYQQKLAQGIANGIIDYLNSQS